MEVGLVAVEGVELCANVCATECANECANDADRVLLDAFHILHHPLCSRRYPALRRRVQTNPQRPVRQARRLVHQKRPTRRPPPSHSRIRWPTWTSALKLQVKVAATKGQAKVGEGKRATRSQAT